MFTILVCFGENDFLRILRFQEIWEDLTNGADVHQRELEALLTNRWGGHLGIRVCDLFRTVQSRFYW